KKRQTARHVGAKSRRTWIDAPLGAIRWNGVDDRVVQVRVLRAVGFTCAAVMSSCGGSEQRVRPTIADPGPAPARAQPGDPFARLNEEKLRVVIVVVRADHPELAFLGAQNTYPARAEHGLDVLPHAVQDCVDSQL